ncbi:MAG: phytanoyl-CoA dioxygenase family protein [Planctomycetes bacterium]|nr:phytanoyl-CoA dioxygenase family protein [Planctomycetota bacterium]
MDAQTHTPAPPVGRWANSLRIPPIESPFLEELLAHASLPPGWDERVRALHRDGYAVLDLDVPDFDEIVERIDDDLSGRYGKDRRVAEAWYWNQDVRDLACLPQVLDVLRLVYQREPIPFQTLNFEVGTEQPAHSDTIHFHSLPRHWMCGVWIAFEDITPDSGPLVAYPGSHRLPDFELHDLGLPCEPENYTEYEDFLAKVLAAGGYEPKHLVMKKGQAVLWLANLIHGGSYRVDRERTRKSLVTHYYFPDCQYFFPMQSDLAAGRITRREVIDIRTGRFVPHRYDGKVVPLGDLRSVCTYPRPLPKWVKGAP